MFISLEDEIGLVPVICLKSLRDAQRKELLESRLLAVYSTWQREGNMKNTFGQHFSLTGGRHAFENSCLASVV